MPQMEPLDRIIGNLAFTLTRAGYYLAVAESCTGGAIASFCTGTPGSSEWFKGGVIAYANDLKERLLGVPAQVLLDHGAVSKAVVEHMALGALGACGAQASVAASGVAGPGGGTDEKPVGTVWIAAAVVESSGACAYADGFPAGCSRRKAQGRNVVVHSMRHLFSGARNEVRLKAAERALHDLYVLLEGGGDAR